MRVRFSERFRRSYESVPPAIRRTFHRKLEFLLQDLRHPSLRAKKDDEARDLWQARVTRGWRFYFTIEGDTPTGSTTSSPTEIGTGNRSPRKSIRPERRRPDELEASPDYS